MDATIHAMSGGDLMPFLIAGALVLFGGQQAVLQEQRLATWKKADMTVTSSVVRTSTRRDSKGRTKTDYDAEIEYTYRVGTVVHRSDRLNAVFLAGSFDGAHSLVRRYPVGKVVQGRHDTSNPPKSFLIAQRRNDPAFAIIGGILLAIVGTLAPKGLISVSRSRRRFGPRGW